VLSGAAARGLLFRSFGLPAGALGVISAILVIIGLIVILIAYGLWEGKKWGWLLAIIIAILHIAGNLIRLLHTLLVPIISIAISIIVIFYLTRPRIKSFFNK